MQPSISGDREPDSCCTQPRRDRRSRRRGQVCAHSHPCHLRSMCVVSHFPPILVRTDYARAMEAFQESLAEQKQQVRASPLVSLPPCHTSRSRADPPGHGAVLSKLLTWNALMPHACFAGCGRATRPSRHAPVAAGAHARRACRLGRATRLPSLPSEDSSPPVGQRRASACCVPADRSVCWPIE